MESSDNQIKQRKWRSVREELDDYINPAVRLHMFNIQDLDGIDDLDDSESIIETGNVRCSLLRKRGYWDPLIKTVNFVVHFSFVMAILFGGAMVLAMIEDPETPLIVVPVDGNETIANYTKIGFNVNEVNEGVGFINGTMSWRRLLVKYSINISEETHKSFLNEVKSFITEDKKLKEKLAYQKLHSNRRFVFLKWFYFVTVATTTVGYGDLAPKTDMGRIFLIFFLAIGVVAMMTLLKSCGAICTAANNKLFGLINRYICRGHKLISEELLSTISITILFICFMVIGIWYAKHIQKMDWSILDIIYFWIITFTTVGLGDMTYPLELEVKHIYEHVVYRIFGLALLAGIIDSVAGYIEFRNEEFRKKQLAIRMNLRNNRRLQKLFLARQITQ